MKIPRNGRTLDRLTFVLCLLLGLSWVMLSGCGRAHPSEPKPPDIKGGGMDGIMRLSGRFGLCTACAVAHEPTEKQPWTTMAVTAGHCVDMRPFDESVGFFGAQWSDGDGHSGLAIPYKADSWRDVAYLTNNGDEEFPHVYKIAEEAPKPGDVLHAIGPDFRDKKRALGDREYAPVTIRLRANHIAMDENTGPGSSGGCVLNDKGEVVGVVSAYFETDSPGTFGYAVGLWGNLLTLKPWKPEPKPKDDPDGIGETLRRIFGNVQEIR